MAGILWYIPDVPEDLPPVYDPEYSELRCTAGTDNLLYGDAGDDIFQHTEHWVKGYGTPFFTGQSLIAQSDGATEMAAKAWSVEGDFDITMYMGQIVFSFPANYGGLYCGLHSPDLELRVQIRCDENYPVHSDVYGVVRTGGTWYNSGGEYTNGEIFYDGRIWARFVKTSTRVDVYFWEHSLGDWQYLQGRTTSTDSPMTPYFFAYSEGADPHITGEISNIIINSADGYNCRSARLGNFTYYSPLIVNYPGAPDLVVTTNSGILINPEDGWSNRSHHLISNPPFLTGAPTGESGDLWEFEVEYVLENILDSRWYIYIEMGFMHTSGYFKTGYTSKCATWPTKAFSEVSAAASLGANNTYNRLETREYNNTGTKTVDSYVGATVPNSGIGTFKIKHTGNNNYEFYYNNILYNTWTAPYWESVSYISNDMYIDLVFNQGYSKADCRWNYNKLTML